MDQKSVEYFIEKVRDNPCLWHQRHVSYLDVSKKESTWKRVAKECGLANGRDAKLQWKKLRDSHREALRRRNPALYGSTAQYLKPWKYEENMKFIVSQTDSNKEASPNSHDPNDVEDNTNEDTDTIDTTIEATVPKPIIQSQDHTYDSDAANTNSDRKKDIASLQKEIGELKKERDRHRDEMLRQAVALNRSDALSKLFDSLCDKTRELPKYLQLRVQREVFESVTRAEEEALSLNSSSMTTESLPSTSHQNVVQGPKELQQEEEDYAIDPEYESKFRIDDEPMA